MLKIEKFVIASPEQWEIIIEGMRNPMNSWEKMDSIPDEYCGPGFYIGENDHNLMMRLANGGPVHAKYRRMIPVYVTMTAPLYWCGKNSVHIRSGLWRTPAAPCIRSRRRSLRWRISRASI